MKECGFKFDSSYLELPDAFYSKLSPEPVSSPEVVIFNEELAEALGLDFKSWNQDEKAELFSGKKLAKESTPFSQAYAGHQFGHFAILGDGRAHILGEHVTPGGSRVDLQLKGSGRTPYSRRGDGRACLGPMLREYIIAEAMNSLGIPTTRALAVVSTGESVLREEALPGAILTRVASSHLRVGTFEFAATKGEHYLKTLLDYSVNRHYPELNGSKTKALGFIQAIIKRQADLIVHWMRVGFIHGVMNTDNMTISGEGIDYGPCAFMEAYRERTVFSSIDQMGRYSYSNQPVIAQWNISRLAETLLPFIDSDINRAIELAQEAINEFPEIYKNKWLEMMRQKLGLFGKQPEDERLISDLLNWMERNSADYNRTFHSLSQKEAPKDEIFNKIPFKNWLDSWQSRLQDNSQDIEKSIELRKSTNPAVIPRNHKIEEVLEAANQKNYGPLEDILAALDEPYNDRPTLKPYQDSPNPSERVYQTFCGT